MFDVEVKGKFIPYPTREGWNDEIAGEVKILSAAEIEASKRRIEEADRKHKEMMAKLTEERSNQLQRGRACA